ncbi:hypothetical protein RhiirA5_434664 [Rhizophagus irregularis]|uniref:Uncharacterized protein n=1 Tax=Rhizophagus irregularis TaxID=588596 RepID=A0A2N0NPR1_9GLOM|nr:hypothetical protein RhiirA5_434664 [Rhizophagus irregularis]GET55495.1 hypothetical protein RIR_e380_A0A2N0NPR1_9GLOM [Rhizophagus irregularis DAOM 181602=DAOM 197198]
MTGSLINNVDVTPQYFSVFLDHYVIYVTVSAQNVLCMALLLIVPILGATFVPCQFWTT